MWTAMIQAYGSNDQLSNAWQLFKEMTSFGVTPDEHIYTYILKVLAEMTNLPEGQRIHKQLQV
jgi:pentatricopeptide repeat protein